MTSTAELALTPRPIASSVEELLADVERRGRFEPAHTRSASVFEQVWIDDVAHVVKYLHRDNDFMLRVLDDSGQRTLRAFAAGWYDVAPDAVDHAVVAAAPHGSGCAFLMRDVSDCLVAPGDDVFPEEQHASFIDHMARMCAATWGWRDEAGALTPYPGRWTFTGYAVLAAEAELGDPEGVARLIGPAWARFDQRAPGVVAEGVDALRRDVTPLASALQATPSCFLHGDWKASNLGTAPDGRTLLLDWVYLGEGPACHELAWYLALNRSKLPTSKEQVMADFRAALERWGVITDGWWERQLGLALLGAVVQLGWDKALGDDEELGWWCDRAREGLAML